ncbi:MAG: hypothetical protein WCK54_04715, partial [Desulfuromonadales bacterium]
LTIRSSGLKVQFRLRRNSPACLKTKLLAISITPAISVFCLAAALPPQKFQRNCAYMLPIGAISGKTALDK